MHILRENETGQEDKMDKWTSGQVDKKHQQTKLIKRQNGPTIEKRTKQITTQVILVKSVCDKK